MKPFRSVVLLALVAVGCSDGTTESPVAPSLAFGASGVTAVTVSADDGAGSLRAAIAEATADESISRIIVHPGLTVELATPIVFSGTQDLEVQGNGLVLDGALLTTDETNLLANGGGDLEISGVTFQNAPGHGLVVQVPTTATGTQRVVLRDVHAIDNLGHGVEINDQEAPDDAGDPDSGVRGNSSGSDASLEVLVVRSRFVGNGFGAVDRDGLRVNEGGLGDLRVWIHDTRAIGNGADGVELDERGPGSSVFEIVRSHFSFNGDYDQSATPDKDDGFDADEADEGDLIVRVLLSTANDNFEEGFDFNENDAGDMRVDIQNSEASRNPEEGIDLEEDDDWQGGGDLVAVLKQVTANGNGGDGGIKIRERGDGDLIARLERAVASENLNGHPNADPEAEPAGISIREQHDGDLTADVSRATADGNAFQGIYLREQDGGSLLGTVERSRASGNAEEGIRFREQSDGDLTAAVTRSSAVDNGEGGVRADQDGAGAGTLTLHDVTLTGGTTGNVPPTP